MEIIEPEKISLFEFEYHQLLLAQENELNGIKQLELKLKRLEKNVKERLEILDFLDAKIKEGVFFNEI